MRLLIALGLLVAINFPAHANDWERFYRPLPSGSVALLPSMQPPEIIPLPKDPGELVAPMWRRGFSVLGFSSFNSPNAKTADAIKLGQKLKASHVALTTELKSSSTVNMPLTLPSTTTSYTSGNVSAIGNGGYATGTYSGTTTTQGTTTTYIPITVSRYEKVAVYFGIVPKQGTGLLFREPSSDEVARYETRHLLVVRAVRDGSTADTANVLEGDTVLAINGEAATIDQFRTALLASTPMALHFVRNGQIKDIAVPIQ